MAKVQSREVPYDERDSSLVLTMTLHGDACHVEGKVRTGIDEYMDFIVKAPSQTQAKELAGLAVTTIWKHRK